MSILGTSANVTAMATVSTNIAGVTSFADRYRVGSSNPASSLDEGDLFFNTTDNALKYYNGSGWASITAGIGSLADDTTPQLGGMLDVNGNHIGDGTLELLKFSETGSAINEFTIANAATGNGPTLSASSSSDSNVDINITPLGTGKTVISGSMNDSISTTGKALVMGF